MRREGEREREKEKKEEKKEREQAVEVDHRCFFLRQLCFWLKGILK